MDGNVIQMSEVEYVAEHDNGGGVCLTCGDRAEGVEPDARNCECENCGQRMVFGLDEALLMGRIEFV